MYCMGINIGMLLPCTLHALPYHGLRQAWQGSGEAMM
jgi:hypothetical protein